MWPVEGQATGGTRGFSAIVIAEDGLDGDTRAAIDAIGGRVVARLRWDEVPARLGEQASRAVFVLETEGVDHDRLAAYLPRVDAVATALDAGIVATLDQGAIDVVAAALLGPRTQMLCAPSLAERVAALAIAGADDGVLVGDTWREREAERLKRLSDEVARIAEVLARLTRNERLERDTDSGLADRRQQFGAEPGGVVEIEAAEVRRAIRARRLRDEYCGAGLFEDPGWDILLDLFAAEIEGQQVSVSSLCIAAAVAPTTALRWIGKLTDAGLLRRQPDPFDRRRAFMELSDRGSRALRDYVAALRRAGLAIA